MLTGLLSILDDRIRLDCCSYATIISYPLHPSQIHIGDEGGVHSDFHVIEPNWTMVFIDLRASRWASWDPFLDPLFLNFFLNNFSLEETQNLGTHY